MEFIIVLYPTSRGVVRDGQGVGQTNVILTMNAGVYTFTLAGPSDYAPSSIDVTLAGTSLGSPMVIEFQPLGAAPAPAPAPLLGNAPLVAPDYLVVLFPAGPRGVLGNGQPIGTTNRVIPLAPGDYALALSGPADFKPAAINVTLADTSPASPSVIIFAPKATS